MDDLDDEIQDAYDGGFDDGYDAGYADGYLKAKKEESCSFKTWFFGHYHENKTVGQKYVMLYEMIAPPPDFLKQDYGYESQLQ